jgi:hypothetical protein
MFCSRIIAAAAAQLQRPLTTVGDPVYSLIILPLLLLLMLMLMLMLMLLMLLLLLLLMLMLMLMLMRMPLLPMAMEQPQGVQRRHLMSYC